MIVVVIAAGAASVTKRLVATEAPFAVGVEEDVVAVALLVVAVGFATATMIVLFLLSEDAVNDVEAVVGVVVVALAVPRLVLVSVSP